MYKFMQRNSKKMMAIFAVVLMVAFVIPSSNRGGRTPAELAVGRIGNQSITQDQLVGARNEWNTLVHTAFLDTQQTDPQTGERQGIPLAVLIDPFRDQQSQMRQQYVASQMEKNPIMFLLLLREAADQGVSVSEKQLASLLSELLVRLPDRQVAYDDVKDQEIGDRVRQSARDLLMIRNAFTQSQDTIKISQPLLNNRVARTMQEIKLQFVELDAKTYLPKVAAPTTQQLTDQFNKYADRFAGVVDPTSNPAGYGYKYSNRVQLAYIGIPHEELRKAIIAGQSDDEWQVREWRYYKHNLSEFPSTAPTTAPATQASAGLTLSAPAKPAAAAPTTRPFEEVRTQVLDALVNPEAEKLGQTIENKITVAISEDWNAYRAAMSAPASSPPASSSAASSSPAKPTTAPVSSVGVAYDSPDYLPKLAAKIQAEFKVIPTVANLSEKPLAETDLQALPGIGKSSVMLGNDRQLPFASYAISAAVAFAPAGTPPNENMLNLFQASRPLSDSTGNTYIFRLTATDPAHKPATLAEVQSKVEQDVRAAAAYAMAQADANAILTAAQDTTISAAAAKSSKTVSDTGYLAILSGLSASAPVSADSQRAFLDQAFDLLNLAAVHKTPLKLISMPQDQKLFVAQLSDVRRIPQLVGMESEIERSIRGELGENLFLQWYNFDAIKKRLNYSGNSKSDSEG